MRTILTWATATVMAVLTFSAGAAVPAKKKTPAKDSGAATTAGKKKPATSSTAGRNTTAPALRGKTPAKRSAVTWRNRQTAPTPARYKEIQQALASKGYLQPEDATGAWTPASSEALKKFQTDQKLEGTGKINALSLIALGLGPKHEDVAAAAPPKPPPSQ